MVHTTTLVYNICFGCRVEFANVCAWLIIRSVYKSQSLKTVIVMMWVIFKVRGTPGYKQDSVTYIEKAHIGLRFVLVTSNSRGLFIQL